MDDEDGNEWCELIYSEALRIYKPTKYNTVNKLRFFALILELFAEMQHEDVIIQVKAVNVKIKLRSKNYIFWVFEMPDFQDKTLCLTYMSSKLSQL